MAENEPEIPKPTRPGPRIIGATPIVITIHWNELTGEIKFATSRDVPFPAIVLIFAKLLTTFVEQQHRSLEGQPHQFPP